MKRSSLISALILVSLQAWATDPLPSWNDGTAKSKIIEFVEKTCTEGSPDFLPRSDRIAVFDNDGCLWSEQPMYFQAIYAFDRVKQLAPQHPEWKHTEPFKSILNDNPQAALQGGKKALAELIMATHAGMTAQEFTSTVRNWLTKARHPETGKAYTEMVFQPMLELLAYLRENGYKTFIVTGGGIDFLRVFAEDTYGIPPEQVIGSSLKSEYRIRDGSPVILKLPELNFIDDKEGKPVGIHQHIGRRPRFAAGNSDGDFQMLEWTTSGDGPRLGMLVHHTDSKREWAYDRTSHVGQLSRGLDEAAEKGWLVVDMKRDWKTIFPNQKTSSSP